VKPAQLFGSAPSLPEGFVYQEDAIAPEEEKHLVQWFASLPFAPFEFHGYLGLRRTVSFGWRYDYGGHRLRQARDLPPILLSLRETAAWMAGRAPPSFEQVLVTEYPAGAGIGWHRDKSVFEDVVAISFVAPCRLRFRRRQGNGWERQSSMVTPRSAYLLRGASRHLWEHSIPAVEAQRYSVTFRTLAR
jgi:alkylated DNA repair dioxygenase AlkB